MTCWWTKDVTLDSVEYVEHLIIWMEWNGDWKTFDLEWNFEWAFHVDGAGCHSFEVTHWSWALLNWVCFAWCEFVRYSYNFCVRCSTQRWLSAKQHKYEIMLLYKVRLWSWLWPTGGIECWISINFLWNIKSAMANSLSSIENNRGKQIHRKKEKAFLFKKQHWWTKHKIEFYSIKLSNK